MIELIGELNTASRLLQVALDRYLGACFAIQSNYTQTTTLTGTLSDCVSYELLSVTSYEKKIKQAKSALSQARNCSADTPIHALPVEILTRIFYLAIGVPCHIHGKGKENTSLPRYPDFLSHVCSRWRQIVLGLPLLWSHIDLLYLNPRSEGFAARAEACVNRAGDLPLNFHIRIPPHGDYSLDKGFYSFMESNATRARSLELVIPSTVDHIPEDLFEYCFRNCTPGALVELTTTDHGQYTPNFIVAYEELDDDIDPAGLILLLPEKVFEDLLLLVTHLRLHGLYPTWESQAYHGLVELRLTSPKQLNISEFELYDILESSPGLRILQFDLHIVTEGLSPATRRADLEDLEVLTLGTLGYNQLATFLGLISVGSKPLHLTIQHHGMNPLSSENVVTKFLKNSNVAKFHLKGSDLSLRAEVLPYLLPQLQVLILDGIQNSLGPRPLPSTHQNDTPRSLPVEAVYILDSHLDLDSVCFVAKKHVVKAIIFWRSTVFCNNKSIGEDAVSTELSKFCPVIEHVSFGKPNPVQE